MATKEEVLQHIKELAKSDFIKKEEILKAFDEGARKENEDSKKLGIAEILYYIGGAIVFFGIAILVSQNWNTLNSFTRIFVTLGSSVVAYFAALLFGSKKKTENVGIAFHLVSALLMPLGLYIAFHEAGFVMTGNGIQALISFILFIVYILSLIAFGRTIFIFFSILSLPHIGNRPDLYFFGLLFFTRQKSLFVGISLRIWNFGPLGRSFGAWGMEASSKNIVGDSLSRVDFCGIIFERLFEKQVFFDIWNNIPDALYH